MKKLLSLLSILTISGTAVPTTIASSSYQKEENSEINYSQLNNLENLNRNKRSVYSFNYGGDNVNVVWQPSWLTYWELEFDNTSAREFYQNFNNYYSQNQSKHSFNEFRRALTGGGIIGRVIFSALSVVSDSWITALASHIKSENKGNGVKFSFYTIVLNSAESL